MGYGHGTRQTTPRERLELKVRAAERQLRELTEATALLRADSVADATARLEQARRDLAVFDDAKNVDKTSAAEVKVRIEATK